MLRQALDAAHGQNEAVAPESRGVAETDSLLPGAQEQGYAATSANEDFEPSESRIYEDEDYLIQDWRENSEVTPEVGILEKIWKGIKSYFLLIVNVENLWDSPEIQGSQVSRRNHIVVLFWFFILATFYASERSTFKLIVDRTAPFRVVAVEMVMFTHALMVGIGMFISALSRKDFTMQALGIPVVDVGRKFLLKFLC